MSIQTLLLQFFEYSKYIKNYSPTTIARYKHLLSYYCKYSKISEIEEVTQENVRNLFYHGRAERNWTPNTFLNYHKTLSVFFRWCIKEKFLSFNPIDDIEKPKLPKCLPKSLTLQEAEKLLETVSNYPYDSKFLRFRNYAIFATFIFAGLRKSELLNLKYSDVDLENLTIFIRQGKGKKDRFIPINHILADALQKYIEVRKKAFKECPYFFTSYTYDMGLTDSGIKRIIYKFSKILGIKFRCHWLRHTFATLLVEGGADLNTLRLYMGHEDIKTTSIYVHVSVQHIRSQILKHPISYVPFKTVETPVIKN
jgi:site-specific recombinase XerD